MPLMIKSIREEKGISQVVLADKLQVNQTAVSQWERGSSYRGGAFDKALTKAGLKAAV